MMNPDERGWFWSGTAIGVGVMTLIFVLIDVVVIKPKLKAAETSVLGTIHTITQQRDACREQFNQGTVLYDFEPMKGLDVGPVSIQPQSAGRLVGSMTARWFIPARVKPTLYGQRRGEHYFWVDHTGKREGPFRPLELGE